MKRNLSSHLLLILLGVILMINSNSCSNNVTYEKYIAKNPEINLAVDYISGWNAGERSDPSGRYSLVHFFEPEIEGKDYRAGMVITAWDIDKVGFEPLTVEAMLNDLLEKKKNFENFQLVSEKTTKLLNYKAIDITLSYIGLDKPYNINYKQIPITERMLVFKKGSKFFTLRYENSSEEFLKYEKAFVRIIKSLKIQTPKS